MNKYLKMMVAPASVLILMACATHKEPLKVTITPDHCQLPPESVITVGCTDECGENYKNAIHEVASGLGYKVSFTVLAKNPSAEVDAILSPGGDDIEPKHYVSGLPKVMKQKIEENYKKFGQTDDTQRARDAFEIEFFKKYFSDKRYQRTPALGICYGMQMLGVSTGLPLYVDIQDELGIPNRRKLDDTINFTDKSPLRKYFEGDTLQGRKNHHQAINLEYYKNNQPKYKNLKFTATSNGGKIGEVMEFSNRRAIGVQFHPERSNDTAKAAVFSWLLETACQGKRDR
jgi:gamma-glutamyl-gamma-aminobutyrate hydrolase PuuD